MRGTTIRLIGRVRAEDLVEVARQLEASGPGAVLQLDEVTLVDVDIHTRVDAPRAEPKPRIAEREISWRAVRDFAGVAYAGRSRASDRHLESSRTVDHQALRRKINAESRIDCRKHQAKSVR